MTDDELAWLLELENPNPPRPLPVDPAGDHWREQPESGDDAPHLVEPGHVQPDHIQARNARAIAPPGPGPGTDDADSVTATAAGTTGSGLATGLESIDPAEVDEYDLVEMIAGYQRLAAWSHSRMTDLTGRLANRPALRAVSRTPAGNTFINAAADELAPRLGISRFAAQRMVTAAELFRAKLEDTGAALREGGIDYAKATVLVRMLGDQPDDVAWEVQQEVLPGAPWMTVTQLEKAVARAIIAVDPDRAAARHRAAREQRRVGHPRMLPDGMASMYAVLPATDAAGLDLALEAAAKTAKAAGDTRTLAQLRADALALLGHGALANGFIGLPAPPTRSGQDDAPPPADGASPPTGQALPSADDEAARASDVPAQASTAPALASDDARHADDAPPREHEIPATTGSSCPQTSHMPIGTLGGRPAQIQVTIPLSVLLPPEVLRDGCTGGDRWLARLQGDSSAGNHPPPSDTPDEDELPDIPEGWYRGPGPAEVAELTGYGPIGPDVALALAYAGGTWQRLVTDPLSGALLDVGRKQYRPPAAIRDFVRLRDGTCVRPGCSVPARGCEADHIVPWSFGGITSADTMACLCPRDHVLKTAGVSVVQREETGAIVWTSPTGHRYRRDHTGRITPLPPTSAVQSAVLAARDQGFADEPPF